MRSFFASLGRNDTAASILIAQHHPPIMEELEGRQLYSASHFQVASATPANLSPRRARHHHAVVVPVVTHPRRFNAFNTDFGGFYGIFSNTDVGGFTGIATGQITAPQAFAPPFGGLGISPFLNPFGLSTISRF